ncbi:Membrane steroid-binding protein 2 [Platanthera zijinensis]|uniref:Membrane steroid-binding protein 2 n=1 Tax=Platanthera zijinensis TaxID=2320716 RepID=A0AAP0G7D7_9ASPA
MGLYSTFEETINSYTGLSPAAFFTILALMVGFYRIVSGLFVSPAVEAVAAESKSSVSTEPSIPLEPVQIGEVTIDELKAYDGSDPKKPLLMAIKGNIYDVSRSRMFYGPGGPYALFAGRDASRALALMSFDHNDLTGNLEGLRSPELEVLQDWEEKFMEKYVKVGRLAFERTTISGNNQNVEALPISSVEAENLVENIENRGLKAEATDP